MSNALYTKGKQKLLDGNINLETDTIKAVLIDTGAYTPNLATHEFLSDVPGGARLGTPQTLANKTFTGGVFDADDVSFNGLTAVSCEAVLLYKDTGVAGTSPLLGLWDTGAGLPVTPSGGITVIAWNASGIFSI